MWTVSTKYEKSRRRAGVYVAVLGSAMMTTVIGLSALLLVRAERRAVQGTTDMLEARFYAQSAVEIGQHRIRSDSDWRRTFASGPWQANVPIGKGTFTLEGVDPVDGDLSDSLADPILLTGTGRAGGATYKVQAKLLPLTSAVEALAVSAHSGGNLTFNTVNVSSTQKVSSNGSATASGSMISCPVEAVGAITGSTYLAARTTGMAARSMPDATVFDYYLTNGSAISYASVPSAQGKKTIERLVLSPSSNPYGATNTEGIYVLDCAGGSARLRNARINGTLVVINASAFSVESSVSWEPAVTNYPSLLVRGNLDLNYTNAVLAETSSNANYNPPGSPYAGLTDTDVLDSYPSLIKGLVYASGAITTNNTATIQGVLVAGTTMAMAGTVSLTYADTFYTNPPPGFGAATTAMQLSAGSWKRIVD